MSNFIDPPKIQNVSIPLTPEAVALAQQHANQHEMPTKQQQVLQNIRAVLAVESYCQLMGIPTDRTASYSFDVVQQTINDSADLYLKGLGCIECREVESAIPPLIEDCLGIVVVQWLDATQTMQIRGFVPRENAQEKEDPLTNVEPIDQLFERIEQLELHRLQIPLEDPVIKRVQKRLTHHSFSALILKLEDLFDNDKLDEDKKYRELGDFLAGRELVEASSSSSAPRLNLPNTPKEKIDDDKEFLELAEDLLDRLEKWWSN